MDGVNRGVSTLSPRVVDRVGEKKRGREGGRNILYTPTNLMLANKILSHLLFNFFKIQTHSMKETNLAFASSQKAYDLAKNSLRHRLIPIVCLYVGVGVCPSVRAYVFLSLLLSV